MAECRRQGDAQRCPVMAVGVMAGAMPERGNAQGGPRNPAPQAEPQQDENDQGDHDRAHHKVGEGVDVLQIAVDHKHRPDFAICPRLGPRNVYTQEAIGLVQLRPQSPLRNGHTPAVVDQLQVGLGNRQLAHQGIGQGLEQHQLPLVLGAQPERHAIDAIEQAILRHMQPCFLSCRHTFGSFLNGRGKILPMAEKSQGLVYSGSRNTPMSRNGSGKDRLAASENAVGKLG